MNTNELRIGNLIASGTKYTDTSSIGKVLSIGVDDCEFEQIYVEQEESFDWFWKGNYCGIPLTEEWLVKFGFKDNGTMFSKPDNCVISHDFKTIGIYIERYEDDITLDCPKYIHQLQNLYFSLIGKEFN